MQDSRRSAVAQVLARHSVRRLLVYLLGICMTLPPTPALSAESSAGLHSVLQGKLARPGDLTLKETPLAEALFTIGEIWGINIVVGSDVEKAAVSGVFQDAPLQEILDAILLSNGYGYRPIGQSLVVMKAEKVGDLNPTFVSATIALPNGVVGSPDLLAAIKLLSSPQGKSQVIPSAASLLVLDFPDRVAAIQDFVAGLARPDADAAQGGPAAQFGSQIDVLHFRPQFVLPSVLEKPIQSLLSADGRIAVIEHEKQIIIVDNATNLRRVERILRDLDVARPQVRITALIYDVSLADSKAMGFNWEHAVKGRPDAAGNPQNLFSLETLTQVPAAAGSPGAAMTFATLNRNIDITGVINFLETKKDSRLLADPSVVAMDSEPVEISSVTEIPYQQLTQTSQGGNIGTTAFREAGVKLKVTPHVADDGTIAMFVSPEFSLLSGFTEGEQPQPIIDRRAATTVVRAANEQTIVIGGLRQRSDNGEFTGVPYLKDIKYIGALFRSRSQSVRESELVVFLTPQLITPLECLRPREQAAYATGTCNLDLIPPGEGCPPCSLPGSSGIPGPEYISAPLPASVGPLRPDGAYFQPNPPRQPHMRSGERPHVAQAPQVPSQHAPTLAQRPITRLPRVEADPIQVAPQGEARIASRPEKPSRLPASTNDDSTLPKKLFRF